MAIGLIAGQIKKDIAQMLYKTTRHFPKLYQSSCGNVKVELGLSNYVPKADFKGATGVDKSNLVAKSK